ncbi:TPA: GlcNAc-PI de-N-acetylase [Patescibacteria group bacterium]|nr:GlcNAc-PI de-N-acetylase [Patescibacteria group bacterium]
MRLNIQKLFCRPKDYGSNFPKRVCEKISWPPKWKFMKNKVMVVAAHPDDEVLGAGGIMLKHVADRDFLYILILGDGESARDDQGSIQKRAKQAQQVAKKIGAKELILEKLPDNKFDSLPLLTITKVVERTIFKIKPNLVYTHFASDLNIDHRLTFQAVLTACRPQPGFFVKKIVSFEVLSSTEWQHKSPQTMFSPTEYINISQYIEKKVKLMKIYKDELRSFPHPRSAEGIKTLAHYRGMEVGFQNAEAFQVVRNIKD